MWDGRLSPDLAKHRDFLHRNFVQHEKANGGYTTVGEPVPVVVNPLTLEALDEEEQYYQITFVLHDGTEYIFLVKSETPGPPSEEEIEEQIEAQLRLRVPGGRHLEDFISDVDVEEVDEPRGLTAFSLSDIMDAVDQSSSKRGKKFSIDDLI